MTRTPRIENHAVKDRVALKHAVGAVLAVVVLLLGAFSSNLARAAESAPARTSRTVASLVTDTDSVPASGSFRAALRLRMADGWHTYWKNPGDAGAPPEFTLEVTQGVSQTAPPRGSQGGGNQGGGSQGGGNQGRSGAGGPPQSGLPQGSGPLAPGGVALIAANPPLEGVRVGPIDWPTPLRLAEGPLMTYAYTNEVLLPVTVTLPSTQGPLTLQVHANWLVCKDICVPEEAVFRLDLPATAAAPSAEIALFAAHDHAVPRPSPWEARIAPDGTLSVLGPEVSTATVTDAWFIPATLGLIQDDAAQPLSVRPGVLSLALKPGARFQTEAGFEGILSVRDRSGQQTDLLVMAQPGAATAFLPLPQMLLFAFLGGLILNLMPCVFPVLAMKAVKLTSGAVAGRATGHAIAYTSGVLAMFAALALALLAARAAGGSAGWGFQFQSPVFVACMAWLLFAVGLNLSGVFQVGGGLAGAGSGLARRDGYAGSFFTGLLAVLVATPCTAPFMGVAIAAGLAAPPSVTVLVFLVMGLGLAAPYVALATLPVSRLPGLGRFALKPGAWMDVLKQALAFPMYGAAVWLLWVVAQETGATGVLATAIGFVLLGFGGWVLGLTQWGASRPRRIGQVLATVAVAASLALLPSVGMAPSGGPAPTEAGVEAFTPARLSALREAGRPVFVNMTAAWCVTCLVNERLAISTTSVRQAFSDQGITYLKGDWTRQDPAITAYLRQNGRDGVPLYVYYPPNGATPVILPQILTEGTVLAALGRG